MKAHIIRTGLLVTVFACGLHFALAQEKAVKLVGGWETTIDGNQVTAIFSDEFFSAAIYNVPQKRFVGTLGGAYRVENGQFIAKFEFNTIDPHLIGQEVRQPILESGKGSFSVNYDNERVTLTQVDNGKPGKLAGAWLITGRVQNGNMGTITPGARRTMKILSGTRFQWIAYNVETREFSGTGGGTYTTKGGKYTEHIEFFSRDGSRVGASLGFDYALEDGNWRHKGLSSRGAPIDEIWTKREKIKL